MKGAHARWSPQGSASHCTHIKPQTVAVQRAKAFGCLFRAGGHLDHCQSKDKGRPAEWETNRRDDPPAVPSSRRVRQLTPHGVLSVRCTPGQPRWPAAVLPAGAGRGYRTPINPLAPPPVLAHTPAFGGRRSITAGEPNPLGTIPPLQGILGVRSRAWASCSILCGCEHNG